MKEQGTAGATAVPHHRIRKRKLLNAVMFEIEKASLMIARRNAFKTGLTFILCTLFVDFAHAQGQTEVELPRSDAGPGPFAFPTREAGATSDFAIGQSYDDIRRMLAERYRDARIVERKSRFTHKFLVSAQYVNLIEIRTESRETGETEQVLIGLTSPMTGQRSYSIERQLNYGERTRPNANAILQDAQARYRPHTRFFRDHSYREDAGLGFTGSVKFQQAFANGAVLQEQEITADRDMRSCLESLMSFNSGPTLMDRDLLNRNSSYRQLSCDGGVAVSVRNARSFFELVININDRKLLRRDIDLVLSELERMAAQQRREGRPRL